MPGNVSMINKDQQMGGGALPITPAMTINPGSGLPGSGGNTTGDMLTTMMIMDRLSKNKDSGQGGLLSGLMGGKGSTGGVNSSGGMALTGGTGASALTM